MLSAAGERGTVTSVDDYERQRERKIELKENLTSSEKYKPCVLRIVHKKMHLS